MSDILNECSGCGGLSDGNTLYQKVIIEERLSDFQKAMNSLIKTSRVIDDIALIINNEINEVLGTYVQQPLTAMMHLHSIMKKPAELYLNIVSKIDGYCSYIDTIIETNAITYSQKALKQGFLVLSGLSLNLCITEGYLTDKSQSLYVENKLLEYENKIVSSLESLEGEVGYNTTEKYKAGEYYVADVDTKNNLLTTFEISRQYLRENLSELPIKFMYTLKKDRNLIDVCAELYRSVEEEILTRFIQDNNIIGDELLIMPKGRVVYYYL